MTNSNIIFAKQDQNTAKAVAGTIGRFLKDRGLGIQHTMALDLVGVLAGFADWRSLQAHLEVAEKTTTLISMSLDEFKTKFKPVKNPNDPTAEFEGFAFSCRGPDMDYVQKVLDTEPERVWTMVSGDVSTWLVSGYHYVNREFYVVTHVPVKAPQDYAIPYGHDEDDKLYCVRAVVQDTDEELMSEEVYASSPSDAVELVSGSIEDATEEFRDEGKLVVVTVLPVTD